ncbi:MAG: hypothetical protein ABSC42_15525 [Tepidisphaeraceae bacterium]|jgi:hypothetical protein
MDQFDGVLRMYADSGLRTVQDWTALGRDVESGAKPRLDTPHRGTLLPLYSRDQTHPQTQSRSKRH